MKRHENRWVKRFVTTDKKISGAYYATELILQEREAIYDNSNKEPNIVTEWQDVPFVDLTK